MAGARTIELETATVSRSIFAVASLKIPSAPATSNDYKAPFEVEAVGVVQRDMHGAAFGVRIAKEGAGQNETLLFLGNAAGEEREAGAYVLLVGGLDVVLTSDVDGDIHAGVGKVKGVKLGLTDHAPVVAGTASVDRQLEEEEGQAGLMPLPAPILN